MEETANFIQLPININIYILFGIIITALSFVLKQGIFLYYQNKSHKVMFQLTLKTVWF